MSKTKNRQGRPAQAEAVVPAAASSAADAYSAFGTGKTDAQMVRKSNQWRDNYNPLRGLIMSRLINMFEAAERGAYAELQLLLRKSEKRYPTLKGFIERLLSSVEELDWDVKVLKVLPPGATPEMAEKQRAFLRSRYDLIGNINEAIGQLVMADIRGYAVLQKHRYQGGDNDGAVEELYWLEPWAWSRDGYYGDFYYNEISRFNVGLGSCASVFGEANRIGSAQLPREEFVIREVESPLYEIALIAFVNWLMGRKDWAAFVEIFGLAKGVVIMPPNIQPGKEQDYQAAAEKVSDGVSGALPAGSDIKFPTAGVRGESPFETFCNAQNEDLVMAATSGLLTMLTHGGGGSGGGLNKGPGEQHHDVWEKIAKMKGKRVNETLRRDFDALEIAAEFPGEPVCAQFTLAVQDDEDVNTVADTVVKFEGVGLQTDAKEISERSGYKLTRVAKAPAGDLNNPATDKEMIAAVKNRLTKILNRGEAPGTVSSDLTDKFAKALSLDLAPIIKAVRDEADAIAQISDPDLREQKLNALVAKMDSLVADALLAPASADPLAEVIAQGLKEGQTTS